MYGIRNCPFRKGRLKVIIVLCAGVAGCSPNVPAFQRLKQLLSVQEMLCGILPERNNFART
jgi:hypothetical protein